MSAPTKPTLHASCLEYAGFGLLIRGASGSGKSSLLMRLLDDAQGRGDKASLIADDRVCLSCEKHKIIMHCPQNIKGLLEVRGVGIISLPNRDKAQLHLVIDLSAPDEFERYPCEDCKTSYFNQPVDCIKIVARNPDAPAIVRTYLRYALMRGSSDPWMPSI